MATEQHVEVPIWLTRRPSNYITIRVSSISIPVTSELFKEKNEERKPPPEELIELTIQESVIS